MKRMHGNPKVKFPNRFNKLQAFMVVVFLATSCACAFPPSERQGPPPFSWNSTLLVPSYLLPTKGEAPRTSLTSLTSLFQCYALQSSIHLFSVWIVRRFLEAKQGEMETLHTSISLIHSMLIITYPLKGGRLEHQCLRLWQWLTTINKSPTAILFY